MSRAPRVSQTAQSALGHWLRVLPSRCRLLPLLVAVSHAVHIYSHTLQVSPFMPNGTSSVALALSAELEGVNARPATGSPWAFRMFLGRSLLPWMALLLIGGTVWFGPYVGLVLTVIWWRCVTRFA